MEKDNTTLEGRIALVRTLMEDFDHAILSPHGVTKYAAAFGFEIECQEQHPDDLQDPEGDLMGLGADILACVLCDKLKVRYANKFGCGSQLREACTKLIAHLEAQRPSSVPDAKLTQ